MDLLEKYDKKKYPYQSESFKVIGACMEVHKVLGKGLLEVVYKDALEVEFNKQNMAFEREKKFEVQYKNILLKHSFYADFVVFDKIILEVKAQSGLVEEHYKQTLNYLAISKMKLALLINFGNDSLHFNRIIL
ncbi:MAG: GxxExxY protein [Bacteroidetes bacterium]|jgi:GxxExxY protein|nr:GxxExxY protein [Bacteroidota bacterium]